MSAPFCFSFQPSIIGPDNGTRNHPYDSPIRESDDADYQSRNRKSIETALLRLFHAYRTEHYAEDRGDTKIQSEIQRQ